MIDRKSLTTFLTISFAVAWLLFLVPLAFTNQTPQVQAIITTVSYSLAMWAPGIGAIVATKKSTGSLKSLKTKQLGPKRYYLWAWLLFPILSVLTGVVTVLFRVAEFDPNLTTITETFAMMPDTGGLTPAIFIALQVSTALILGPLFNTLFAFGEELGWRGFLLPQLLPLGQWKAILISSAIWGIWHAPAIMQGLNYPGYPIVGILMMTVFTILTGIILSWLYLNTQSPWTPALAHGSINAVAGLSVLFLLPGFDIAIGGTLASIMGWIPIGLFVLWLILTRRVPVSGIETKSE